MTTNTKRPIIFSSGAKGGVGKSLTALAVLDYLTAVHERDALLVETDTSNPDVLKSCQGAPRIECVGVNLDEANGWIDLVNALDAHSDRVAVVNTAARNADGVARYGETLTSTLGELDREMITL